MDQVKDFFSFRFKPGPDTGVAVGSLLLFWLLHFLGYLLRGLEPASGFLHWLTDVGNLIVWFMMGNIFLAVFFPVAYITHERRQGLEKVGVRKDNLPLALVLSLVAGGIITFGLFPSRLTGMETNLATLLIGSALTFWEPFFIFGWLQLRFDRAFGGIISILLAGGAFALFRVGTVGTDALIEFLIVGLILAFVFRLTKNIFSIYPIASTVSVAVTTAGMFNFDYDIRGIIGFSLMIAFQIMAFSWLTEQAMELPSLETGTVLD